MAWTYRSDIKDIRDYSGVKEPERRGKSNNDIYMKIKDIDDNLKRYFKKIDKVLDEEKSYGLNVSNLAVDGDSITDKLVKDIRGRVSDLNLMRRKVKKRIKKATLEKRKDILNTMKTSFEQMPESQISGRGMYKGKYDEVKNEYNLTVNRLGKL